MFVVNKKLTIFLNVTSLLSIIAIILVYLISDASDIKNTEVFDLKPPEILQYVKEDNRLDISYAISSEELDSIIFSKLKGNEMVRGVKTEINNGEITLYISSKFAGIIPTVYTMKFNLSNDNKSLKLHLIKAKIGKLTVSSKAILNKLNSYNIDNIVIDEEKGTITIDKLLGPFEVNRINADKGKLNINFGYTIKSIKDILKLLQYGLPDSVKKYIERFNWY